MPLSTHFCAISYGVTLFTLLHILPRYGDAAPCAVLAEDVGSLFADVPFGLRIHVGEHSGTAAGCAAGDWWCILLDFFFFFFFFLTTLLIVSFPPSCRLATHRAVSHVTAPRTELCIGNDQTVGASRWHFIGVMLNGDLLNGYVGASLEVTGNYKRRLM